MVKLGGAIKRVIASVDWGFTNPGVILVWAVDGDSRMYLIHQIYRTRQLIEWWVEQAKIIQAAYKPEVFVCDPSEPAYVMAFRKAGLHAMNAINDIAPGIQAVQSRLRLAEDGRPRLFLMRGSLIELDEELAEAKQPTSAESEFTSYVWPKGADGKPKKEVPVDAYNHALDAIRYGVMYVDGRPAPAARAKTSGLWERRSRSRR